MTDSERFKHVRAWKASGKTRSEYAKQHGVSPASLTVWNSQFRDRVAAAETTTAVPKTFVELPSVASSSGKIELQVRDVIVRLTPPIDVDTLVALLAALEAPR